MISLLGDNHCLPLFHMDKSFIWIEEKKELISEFSTGYMNNPKFNINKAFIEQVNKCMNNTFGPSTQLFIGSTLAKSNSRVLEILIFYETRKILRKISKC